MTELHHLVSERRTGDGPVGPGLVVLHGWGADEQDLFSLAPLLDDRLTIISPRGPVAVGPGFGWYQVSASFETDLASFDAGLGRIETFLAGLPGRYQIDPGQLFVLGFSQGAVMTAALTLAGSLRLAGSVLLSGRLPPPVRVIDGQADLHGFPLFVGHGELDPVTAVEGGEAARDYFAGHGANVEYRSYPYGHEISFETIEDLNRWFAARLPETR